MIGGSPATKSRPFCAGRTTACCKRRIETHALRRMLMIGQRQVDFRHEYRSRILGWYDGYFHIAIIYTMGAAAFYIYVEHIHGVSALEWLTVPLTFLFHH